VDDQNRYYLWKIFLEKHGGKYAIIDNLDSTQESSNTLFESEGAQSDLVHNKIEISTIINSDSDLYSTICDLENQTVIAMDIERTRTPITSHKLIAEKIITHYCKTHQIGYKQGLNEIAAPFILLYKQSGQLDDFQIYNCFTRFMHIFLPTFYSDSEFLSLQCSLGLFELLLKYHDPEVALFLRNCKISSDIYAFNWFITLFASKLPLDLVYILWDFIIQEGD
jgi:hypothetical protein